MRKWRIRGAAAVLLLLLMAVAGSGITPVYYLNDDVTMRSILSGAYLGEPDGHAVYMKYPLTCLLAGLYRLGSGLNNPVPWFDLFLAGCILLAGAGILARSWELAPEKSVGLRILWGLTGVLLFAGMLLPQYLYMHYTIIAAILAGSALFLWETGVGKGLPVLLLGLCFLVRSQVFFLSLPFLGVAVLDRLLQPGKAEKKKIGLWAREQGIALLLLAAVITAFWGIDRAGYADEAWRSYREYNDSRTLLYDYTDFLSTNRYEEMYEQLGLTREQFAVLSHYDTLLDQNIDTQVLDRTLEQLDGLKAEVTAGELLKQDVRAYYSHIRYDGRPYSFVWLGCYGILLILLATHKKWERLLLLAALAVGRSLIWIYLIAQGRFPERIWISLYLIEILLLLGMLLGECRRGWDAQKSSKRQWIRGAAVGLCLLLLGGVIPGQMQETARRVTQQRSRQEEWVVLTESLEGQDGSLYLMDVFSAVAYAGELYKTDAEQIMLLGGWLTHSPLAERRLARYGAGDAAEALLHPKVYLIAEKGRDMAWMQSYLEERLGEVHLKEKEYVACGEDTVFIIYQLER